MAHRTEQKDFSGRDGVTDYLERPKEQHKLDPQTQAQEDPQLREFLQHRHGKLDLNPLPSMSLNDPLNWPHWKKNTYLFLLAFHAFFALFMFAGLIPGYEAFAKDYKTSLTEATYLTAVQILAAGVAPVFWSPLSARYGRRPILLISTLGSCVANIGGANAFSYGAQIVCRVIVGIFISPPMAIGTGIVAETFFAHERGTKMGVWTLFLTVSTAVGPFLMGFLFQRRPVTWVFYFFAIVNFCQFLAYFFLNAESLYVRPTDRTEGGATERKQKLWTFRRINPAPLRIGDFFRFLKMGKFLSVLIPACAYTVVFGYAGIAITVEIPQVMGRKFHLDAQGTGLQFIAIIIGAVLGEQFSAWTSDRCVRYFNKRRYDKSLRAEAAANGNGVTNDISRTQTIGGTTNVDPTPRLYIGYIGFLTAIVGLIVWGIESEVAKPGNWTVKPLVGAAIATFGLQAVTTTLVTFAVDCHRVHAADIGVFINVIRQSFGFAGPFYFPPMFENLGFGLTGGVLGAICGFFWALVVFLQFFEKRKFKKRGYLQQ